MKKIVILLITVFSYGLTYGQIEVLENSYDFGKDYGNQKGFQVIIDGADDAEVEKEWKKLLKDYNPEKISAKKVIFADNATITEISTNTVDIISKIEQKGEKVYLSVGFDLGGAYLNTTDHAAKAEFAKALIKRFATKIQKALVEDKLEAAIAVQDEMNKSLETLDKEVKKATENIANWKEDIIDAEQSISKNEAVIDQTKKDLEKQKVAIQEIEKELSNIKIDD